MGTFLWLRLHSKRCFHFRLTNYLTKELMGMERTYVDIEGELELLTTSEQEMEVHRRILSRRKSAVYCQPKIRKTPVHTKRWLGSTLAGLSQRERGWSLRHSSKSSLAQLKWEKRSLHRIEFLDFSST